MRSIRRAGLAVLAITFCLAGSLAPASAKDSSVLEEADHAALRGLLEKAKAAMEARDFAKLRPLLDIDAHFTLITVDNQKFETVRGFETYFTTQLEGGSAPIQKVLIKPTADAKTELFGELGICHGRSVETYTFLDGDVRSMNTRWTAVLRKVGGQWRISKVHFSASILDNPVLRAAGLKLGAVAGIGAVAGMILGALLMALLKRGGGAGS